MKDISGNGFFAKAGQFFSALSDKFEKFSASEKKPGKKVIIIGFVVMILALGAFSAITLIDENSGGGDSATTDMGEIDPAVLNSGQQILNTRLLFAFTDTAKTQVLSVMSVNFDSGNAKLEYCFIPTGAQIYINGTAANLSGHLVAGGTNQLMMAINEYTGIQYDRYVVADESSFLRLLQLLGETTVDVEQRISYEHNGVSFIIDEGTQALTPDNMLKYYLYLISNNTANSEKIAGIIINCIERLVSCEDDVTLEGNFCTALGYFDTNISALDFSNNKELLKSLPGMKLMENAEEV